MLMRGGFSSRVLQGAVLAAIGLSASCYADITRWDTGQVIPGTEGKTPGPNVDLSNLSLQFANLSSFDLTGAKFGGSDLSNAKFSGATLAGADFSQATINQVDLSNVTAQGFTVAQLQSTLSYQNHTLTGIQFFNGNLSGANFSGQNLNHSSFPQANLTNVNFSNADLSNASPGAGTTTNANFSNAIVKNASIANLSYAQITSTSSYQHHDLGAVILSGNLSNDDFSGQNLQGARFLSPVYGNTNFTDADLRESNWSAAAGAITRNTISPTGFLSNLNLLAGETFVVRKDFFPATITGSSSLDSASTIKFLLDQGWTSPLEFLTPNLHGTLDIEFADTVNPNALVDQTFSILVWDSHSLPQSQFDSIVTAPNTVWDFSNLYTTGNVTLLSASVPEPGSVGLLGVGVLAVAGARRRHLRR